MEEQGFVCRDGSNVADFLTGITVPTERLIQPGHEATFPRTATAVREIYHKSPTYPQMISEYEYPGSEEARVNTEGFKQRVALEKHKGLAGKSPLTVGFPVQVRACVARQYQIIWGDKSTFFIKQISTVVQAVIIGSLFYGAPDDSSGLFIKAGALFFSVLFNSLMAMSEVTDSFTGRPILTKHKAFALYHPAAFCIAQLTADIPIILLQISSFSVILYFMTGLTMSASIFFTYWAILVSTTMVSTNSEISLARLSNAYMTYIRSSLPCSAALALAFHHSMLHPRFLGWELVPWSCTVVTSFKSRKCMTGLFGSSGSTPWLMHSTPFSQTSFTTRSLLVLDQI